MSGPYFKLGPDGQVIKLSILPLASSCSRWKEQSNILLGVEPKEESLILLCCSLSKLLLESH